MRRYAVALCGESIPKSKKEKLASSATLWAGYILGPSSSSIRVYCLGANAKGPLNLGKNG